MATELVTMSSGNALAVVGASILPAQVERAGGAARFAWDEFFYAEHHNPPGGETVPGPGRQAGG
jgi:integrase/recombinase XerD